MEGPAGSDNLNVSGTLVPRPLGYGFRKPPAPGPFPLAEPLPVLSHIGKLMSYHYPHRRHAATLRAFSADYVMRSERNSINTRITTSEISGVRDTMILDVQKIASRLILRFFTKNNACSGRYLVLLVLCIMQNPATRLTYGSIPQRTPLHLPLYYRPPRIPRDGPQVCRLQSSSNGSISITSTAVYRFPTGG